MTESDPPDDKAALRRERLFLRDTFCAIDNFLFEMRTAGLLTKKEYRAIGDAHLQVFDAAGITAMSDSFTAIAVDRNALHQMRLKIIELHPEWTDRINELTRLRGPSP